MHRFSKTPPPGFTLIEMIAAMAILAGLSTATFAVVRTSHDAWVRHRDDSAARRQATAALQHIVRRVRQACAVNAISGAADSSGHVSVVMPDGTISAWDHDAVNSRIMFGHGAPSSLLAQGITQFTMNGLAADGTTVTADASRVHGVRCVVGYPLTRPAGPQTETMSCLAWLRAW